MMDKRLAPMPKNLMFALDIGTRSVVGVISKKGDKTYDIIDVEVMEHPERAMFDGQIHDIQKVTEVVKSVVNKLEERQGYRIEQAAIAAAGRALKTKRTSVSSELDMTKEIDKVFVDQVEMLAVQDAQKKLSEDEHLQTAYYCVGYSVIQYALDGSMILNPIGHRGHSLNVDVIATFLPHIVVDSLYAVIHKAGLEVMNLTLEPIAAMNVAIAKNLRLLNLALVDVGAGTSDIAISKDGSVVSYGMVSLAGDEITEKLAQTYLLDFNTAERLKIQLNQRDSHQFSDILGISHDLSTQDILETITDTIDYLTSEIARTLLEINKKPPSAVFCIGGGSQIPGFTKSLARALSLQAERVVIKTVETLEQVAFECGPLKGPEFITPIGIGITAFEERDHDFIQVNVNETMVRLFHTKPLHVSDALILAGFNARSLISERGESFFVTVDGVTREIRGDYGDPAKIFINGVLSALDGRIQHKDHIQVIPASKGKLRKITLGELVSLDTKIYLNDEPIRLIERIRVNGVHRTETYALSEGDVIETIGLRTVQDLAQAVSLDLTQYRLRQGEHTLEAYDQLVSGKKYTYSKVERKAPELETQVNADEVPIERETITVMVNEAPVEMKHKKNQLVFVDIFDYIAFDLSKPQGILHLKLNGERARYTDPLRDGDVVELFWKK